MKKALMALAVAGFVLMGSLPAAQAVTRGTRCDVHTHLRNSGVLEAVEVCVSVNTHDFLGYDEGYAHVHKAAGYPLVNDDKVQVYVFYLKLFADGDLKRQTNPDRWYTGLPFQHSTDWWGGIADTCRAKFHYKIKWAGGDITYPLGDLASASVNC